MRLSFSYSLDKDVENFLKGSQSVNNPKPTKLRHLYVEKFGEVLETGKIRQLIENLIRENHIDVAVEVQAIKTNWLSVEDKFMRRVEEIFGVQYPRGTIEVFLTTNSRCTYNVREGYFFVNLQSEHTNAIIMHELFHFYTWQRFYEDLTNNGVSKEQYNDIKESLTELLNLELSDLMNGVEDKGYAQHRDMRARVRELWAKDKNIKNLVKRLIS